MSEAVAHLDDAREPEEVDLDLDAEDQLLREAVGQPVTVRMAGKVIAIPHPEDWPHAANEAASQAQFTAWAAEVLDEDDLKVFLAAKLRNYQVKSIFEHVNKKTGVSPGKSPSSRPSSKGTRRK